MADGMAPTPAWSLDLSYGAILVLLAAQGCRSLVVPPVCSRFAGFTANTKGRCLMRRIGGTLLTVTGFLSCPCHLIITLPWLASLLVGTALDSFLSRNTGLVYTGAAIYFVVARAVGAAFLFGPKRQSNRGKTACSTCIPADAHASLSSWQSSRPEDLPVTRRYHRCQPTSALTW